MRRVGHTGHGVGGRGRERERVAGYGVGISKALARYRRRYPRNILARSDPHRVGARVSPIRPIYEYGVT